MCKTCELIVINNVSCHETGCPDAWKDYLKECDWCGNQFQPDYEQQNCCGEDCYRQFCGEEMTWEQ